MTTTSGDCCVSFGHSAGGDRLDAVPAGVAVQVVGLDGDDALSERLTASGIWLGAVLERIARAPFGGPILFRLHGYRLALRRGEAERVRVRKVELSE